MSTLASALTLGGQRSSGQPVRTQNGKKIIIVGEKLHMLRIFGKFS